VRVYFTCLCPGRVVGVLEGGGHLMSPVQVRVVVGGGEMSGALLVSSVSSSHLTALV
jgi:hypothetical protein